MSRAVAVKVKQTRHQHTLKLGITVSVDVRDPERLRQVASAFAAFSRGVLSDEEYRDLTEQLHDAARRPA